MSSHNLRAYLRSLARTHLGYYYCYLDIRDGTWMISATPEPACFSTFVILFPCMFVMVTSVQFSN